MAKLIRTWFPDADQIAVVNRRSTSYFHSLFVGFTAPILNLPIMIWDQIVIPVIDGVIHIIAGTAISFVAGAAGLATGIVEHPDDHQV